MSAPSYRRRVLGVLVLAAAPILAMTTAGAALPPGTPVLHQTAELMSAPLGTQSRQGGDVALSADGATLAVASRTFNDEGPSTVVVYVRSAGRWLTQATLREAPTSLPGSGWASAVAISADGDTLAVSNPTATVRAGGTSFRTAGVVHVFARSGQTWRSTGQLVAAPPRTSGWFGTDVSLSGDGTKVAVGGDGHAYVGDTVSRVVQELPEPAGTNPLGRPVAISANGTKVAVGAPRPGWDGGFGEVRVLVHRPGGGWSQHWRLEGQPGEESRGFGSSVAITDELTVVVGAPVGDRSVSVYDRRGEALVRTARFVPRYDQQVPMLGFSVAVSADGSTVVAGAPERDAAGGSAFLAGAGYRWVRSPGGWSWGGLLSVAHPNDGEAQGHSTAVSGDGRVVVIGAPGRSSAQRGSTGAAIVFSAVP